MSDKFFLDTNIFVYEASPRFSAKQAIAARLIDEAFASGKGVVSFQVVQEFFSVAFRRFSPPISPAEAQQKLAITFAPLLSIHSSQELYYEAIQLNRRFSLSWYDSVIVAAALQDECGILYTEDFQHGQKFFDLQVVNPFI